MKVLTLSNQIKRFLSGLKEFVILILKHNIFFHASSISYYAALAIAPVLLIMLQIAALMGTQIQTELISQTYYLLGPEVGKISEMIFNNANQGINLASVSGLIGVIILLFTASIVFLQLRFSLDSIYGDFDPDHEKGFLTMVKERILSMGIVIATAGLFLVSLFISYIVKYFAGKDIDDMFFGYVLAYVLGFLINMLIFTVLYYFAPSRKPDIKSVLKVATITSVAFIVGKVILGLYFKKIAMNSVYGATGTLLVFLIWTYYSAFTLFLSLEGFLFFHPDHRRVLGKVDQFL
ncbi:MAG: YihY/virulence factor BrkB family protein [Rhizobacter sp.]|nr:YihY/virulence factor BrkB family protein [Bacteriovorax sp.]